MPMYDYQCPKCGAREEAMRSVDARADGPGCSECGEKCEYRISAGHRQIYSHGNKARRHAREQNLGEV